MRFSKLHLENWRNFTFVDVPLQQRMFLVGANATGKSNLLDLFRFLQDSVGVGGGFEKAITDRGGVSHLRSLVAPGSADIVIDVQIANGENEAWRYRLAFTEDEQHRPLLKEEKVWRSNQLLLERPNQQDADDKELLHQTYLEQSNSNREFREIVKFFNTIRYYHIVPQLVRQPERSPRVIYDPYGRDFIAQIAHMPEGTLNTRLRLIDRALRAAIPQFSALQVYRDVYGYPHIRAKYEHWQSGGDWQTETDLSDGTLRLIGLIWALLDEAGPLLLEEPELSLQQEVIRYIPGMMAYIQMEHPRQIIVSTHSSDLLQDEGIAPDEILVLHPTPSGTQVQIGIDVDEIKILVDAGFGAGEATLPRTQPPSAAKLSFFGE